MGWDMESKHDIISEVGRTWFACKKFARRLLVEKNYDLTFEQLILIFSLGMQEGARIGELAEISERDKTTTSRMIDGLEKKGLVIKVPDKADSRQKLVYLTRSAKERLEELKKFKKEFEAKAFRAVSSGEMAVAADLLHKIASNIELE